MATYVLIHGGGHGGWCYDKVTRLLGAEMIEKARADGRLWDVETGHDLMITEPEKVTAILEEIAAR